MKHGYIAKLDTIKNPSESEDKPLNEKQVTVVTIQQTKHALQIFSRFFETTTEKEDVFSV